MTLASDHHWAGVSSALHPGHDDLADGLAIGAGLLLHRRLRSGAAGPDGLLFLLFGLWLLFDDALGFKMVAIAVTAALV